LIQEKSVGGAQPFVSLKYFRNYLFPLPPLAEQKRIAEKTNQLMNLCNELEAGIKENQKNSEFLMEAVMKEAFGS
jgi:type I restriction enzyme S subunit